MLCLTFSSVTWQLNHHLLEQRHSQWQNIWPSLVSSCKTSWCSLYTQSVVIMTFFGFSFIYILYMDAGVSSYFVFRLGWTAGRSVLTIPTCVQSSIRHRLKLALSWPAVSDDCLSRRCVHDCFFALPDFLASLACHRASQQPVAKPDLTSFITRSPWYGAYEPSHKITWTQSLRAFSQDHLVKEFTNLLTRSSGLNKLLFPSNPSVLCSLLDPVLSEP